MKITRVLLLIAILFMILVTSKVFGASADEPDSVTGVTGDLALNHTITVKVSPPKYLDGKELDKFLLYLDWRPIKGVTARLIKNGLDKENPGQLFPDRLAFDVKRTGDSKDQWNALLGSPKGFSKETAISIGYGNEKPINTKIDKYPLIVIKSTWFWIFIALFILAVVGFLYLARTTAIIRDPSTLDPEKRPYSLGRTQMAFWFFIVVASYIFLWIVTGDFETITKQVLVLMGISASSALGAVAIDKHKDNVNKRNFQKLQEERKALQARLKTLEDSINEAIEPERSILQNEQANKKARKSQVIEEIDELWATLTSKETKGFVWDLITDDEGVGFHRFQIFIWTIILGFVFFTSMYQNLAMPQFSDTLLTLMGISGGTYVGFKFREIK